MGIETALDENKITRNGIIIEVVIMFEKLFSFFFAWKWKMGYLFYLITNLDCLMIMLL
jgi:hypothetical protein